MMALKAVKATPYGDSKKFIRLKPLFLGAVFMTFALLRPLNAALPAPESLDWGPSTVGFAGSAAAMPSDHDAFLTNPALLFYYQGKNVGAGSWRTLPGDNQMWNVSVVDGISLPTVSGFQFGWADFAGGGRRMNLTTGAAYKTPYGAAGATIEGVNFAGVGPGRGWHLTGSAGVFVPVVMGLSLGAYTKHFLDFEPDSALPPDVHMAALYTFQDYLRMTFEAGRRFKISNEERWNYSTAADFLFKDYFAVRGGYRWDHTRAGQDFWSMGGAVLAQKIELVSYFMQTTEGRSKRGFGFSVTIKQ